MTVDFSSLFCRLFVLSGVVLLSTVRASAQLHPPEIRSVYPLGGRPGGRTLVTITGMSFRNAEGFLFDRTGITAKTLPADPATLPALTLDSDGNPDVHAEFTVSADAAPGLYHFRVVSPAGVSSVGAWMVGRDLPDLEEREPNNDRAHAQPVTLPTAINGHIGEAGDQDTFALTLEAGHTLVAEVIAAQVDSPLDSLLTLRDSEGRELVSNDDYNGSDSLLIYPVKTSGRYFLTIASAVGTGGPNFAYRLEAGYLPLVTAVYPAGVQRGKVVEITPAGINLPAGLRKTWPSAADGAGAGEPIWFSTPLGVTNAMPVVTSSLPVVNEQEPNDDLRHATAMPAPGIANGRFQRTDGHTGGDTDYYRFHAEAGRRYIVEAQCQAIGTRADPVLVLLDGSGKMLEENDDAVGRDSRIDRTFDKTGDYFLRVREVTGRTGPDMVYRLVIQEAPPPGFSLATETRARAVGRGDSAPLEISVDRDRWDGPVTLTVTDLPPGVTASTEVVPAGVGRGLLVLTAAKDAPLGPFSLHVAGTAQVNGQTVHRVLDRASDWVWFGGDQATRPIPPSLIQFAIVAPFEVAPQTGSNALTLAPGQSVKLTVSVARRAAPSKPVTLRVLGLPDGVEAGDVSLAPEKTAAEIEIKAGAGARPGVFPITVSALATNSRYGNSVQLDRATPAITLTLSTASTKATGK